MFKIDARSKLKVPTLSYAMWLNVTRHTRDRMSHLYYLCNTLVAYLSFPRFGLAKVFNPPVKILPLFLTIGTFLSLALAHLIQRLFIKCFALISVPVVRRWEAQLYQIATGSKCVESNK